MNAHCARAASCEENMAIYRAQKVAGSWIADDQSCRVGTSPDCVRTAHDKPGSVYRVNRGRQVTRPADCRHALPVHCNLVRKMVKS